MDVSRVDVVLIAAERKKYPIVCGMLTEKTRLAKVVSVSIKT
jgi:hypothetical protein